MTAPNPYGGDGRETDIGEHTCSDCGAVWRGDRVRFCGRCGAALPRPRRRSRAIAGRRRLLVVAGAVLLLAAIVTATPDLARLWPDGRPAAGGLGVELPPPADAGPPPSPSADTRPSARADTPPVPVRCRDAARCTRWRLPPTPPGAGAPAVTADGHLVAVTAEGLAGFEAGTGERLWDTAVDHGGAVTLTAIEASDRAVLAVGPAERVWTLDAGTGAVIWEQRIAGAYAVRSARVAPEHWSVAVRVRAEDGLASAVAVLAVDPATGEARWRRDAADVALTPAGAVLQDTQGVLSGLAPADGATRWALPTARPAADLTVLGEVLVVSARADALVVDLASGQVREELASPPSTLLSRDGVMLWGGGDGVDYLDGAGRRWTTTVAGLGGCCAGFAVDPATVSVLSGRGELVHLDRRTGDVVGRGGPDGPFADTAGPAWLQGPLVVVRVVGSPGGLGQIHDAATGRHLADVTEGAHALTPASDGDWLVLAAELAATLSPVGGSGRPASIASARPRIR